MSAAAAPRLVDADAPVEKRGWADLDAASQATLLAMMPKSVQKRVREGGVPSEEEVAGLIHKHYDVNCFVILWQVSDSDPTQRVECRRTVKDAFKAARISLEKQIGPVVRNWTDLQVLTMAVPAPAGHHWEMTTERKRGAT